MATKNVSPRANPYTTFNFEVAISGILIAGFKEVTGLESAIKTEPYREGGQNAFQHQMIGGTEPSSNLVLKQGLTHELDLWRWYQYVHQKVDTSQRLPLRVPVIIFLNDRDGKKVRWWLIRNATPIKWIGPTFNSEASGGSAIAIETLEIAHQGIFSQGTDRSQSLSNVNKLL
ncbi:MAG: phage tail protein [Phototrophicaceae bacterium]